MFSKDWHVFDTISIKFATSQGLHICYRISLEGCTGIGGASVSRVRNKVIRKWGKVAEVIFNSISFYMH